MADEQKYGVRRFPFKSLLALSQISCWKSRALSDTHERGREEKAREKGMEGDERVDDLDTGKKERLRTGKGSI